jgi:Domain of Unknown Function (DUF1080)
VGNIDEIGSVREVIEQLRRESLAAKDRLRLMARKNPLSAMQFSHDAWRGYRLRDFPRDSWVIEGGTLRALAGGPCVSLVSEAAFGDFELTVEWKLPSGGNSGILFRVLEDQPEPWQSGPEMQLLDNEGHPDGKRPETSCGALYGLLAPDPLVATPSDRFHVARVTVRVNTVEHWLNGVRVAGYEIGSWDFMQRVKQSKFAAYPRFALARHGHIALQHHGTDAWFRMIHIERLDA